ncbi:MAG: hypothetical protein GEV13_13655 [Rhodospirillales bacterium]|nr:hypothetical protein [Rhodospirillales bacterium]
MALARDAFSAEGVEIRFTSSPHPSETALRVMDGTVDVSWGGPMRVMETYHKLAGCDLVWFAAGKLLRIRSLTLTLDDPQPSYEYELDGGPPGALGGRFGGPVGFDGRFAVGGRMPYGPSAARGAWSADGASLVVEVQTLGNDDAMRVTHVFGDRTVEVSVEAAGGFRAKVQGRVED